MESFAFSDLDEVFVDFLTELIRRLNATSLLEFPCGNTSSKFKSWELDSLDAYVGLDVTDTVVVNSERLWFHTNKQFAVWDVFACPLPRFRFLGSSNLQSFDIVVVRDIQFVPPLTRTKTLSNIKRSGTRWLVASMVTDADYRSKTADPSWHHPPLSLLPIECVERRRHSGDKDLICLYALAS